FASGELTGSWCGPCGGPAWPPPQPTASAARTRAGARIDRTERITPPARPARNDKGDALRGAALAAHLLALLRRADAVVIDHHPERGVVDTRQRDVVDVPARGSGRGVGADAEPDLDRLAGERRPEVERLGVGRRIGRVGRDVPRAPAERV